MQSSAKTVHEYLDELSIESRAEVAKLRDFVVSVMPEGFEEVMAWGMICYQVPITTSGPTYNKEPLVYAAIAQQKKYISLYLMGVYASEELTSRFERQWKEGGRKLNMGKSCIRFKNTNQISFDAIKLVLESSTPEEFTKTYLEARTGQKRGSIDS